VEYWAMLFAVEGFFGDCSYDGDRLSPRAVLLRRQRPDRSIGDVVVSYELVLSGLRPRRNEAEGAAVRNFSRMW
jgi:hypothetical protein